MKIECHRTRLSDGDRRGTDYADALRWIVAEGAIPPADGAKFGSFLSGQVDNVLLEHSSGYAFEFSRIRPMLRTPASDKPEKVTGVSITGQRELVPTGHLMAFTGLLGQLRVSGFYVVGDDSGLNGIEEAFIKSEASDWLRGIALTADAATGLVDLGEKLSEYCVEPKP